MRKQAPSLAEQTAARLSADLAAFGDTALPSLGELASRYGVSWVTIRRAAGLLRDRGLLEYRRGCRPRKPGTTPAPAERPPRRPSDERLFRTLLDKIERGDLRVGAELPPIGYLQREHRVSNRTVRRAYDRLCMEGVAHREGRSRRVGPSRVSDQADTGSPGGTSVRFRPETPLTIVVVQKSESAWRDLASAERTSGFCRFFTDEAYRHRVGLQPVLASEEPRSPYVLPAGHEGLSRAVRALENRYLGAVIAASRGELHDFDRWVAQLVKFAGPVVWFDRNDEARELPEGPVVRCHFDERAAVDLAVDHLAAAGHRNIAFVTPSLEPWVAARRAMVRESAARRHPSLNVVDIASPCEYLPGETARQYWADLEPYYRRMEILRLGFDHLLGDYPRLPDRDPGFPDLSREPDKPSALLAVARWADKASAQANTPPDHQSYRAAMGVRYASTLVRCLRNPDVTAIIAPSDTRARRYYYWLRQAGLEIPRDLSLISFDNYLELHPLPVTTVDFGFSHLGYSAFHLVYRDIRVRRTNRNAVPARPHLVVRGSVARPRASA